MLGVVDSDCNTLLNVACSVILLLLPIYLIITHDQISAFYGSRYEEFYGRHQISADWQSHLTVWYWQALYLPHPLLIPPHGIHRTSRFHVHTGLPTKTTFELGITEPVGEAHIGLEIFRVGANILYDTRSQKRKFIGVKKLAMWIRITCMRIRIQMQITIPELSMILLTF